MWVLRGIGQLGLESVCACVAGAGEVTVGPWAVSSLAWTTGHTRRAGLGYGVPVQG